jgi:hypothetical protein
MQMIRPGHVTDCPSGPFNDCGAGMLRGLIKVGGPLAAVIAAAGLAGCAESAVSYPSIANISDVRVLSPQERDKALKDLTIEKQKQGEAAKDATH